MTERFKSFFKQGNVRSWARSKYSPFRDTLTEDWELCGEVFKTKDFREGGEAFLEEAKPIFIVC
jgi:hypothetical protein